MNKKAILNTTDAFLSKANGYSRHLLLPRLQEIVTAANVEIASGSSVLLKPNFVANSKSHISCTNPHFILAVSEIFLDMGARVSVGDSPAFGSASKVSLGIGLKEILKGLPVDIVNFTPGPRIPLSKGGVVKVAVESMESDLLVNLPKLKAHSQVGLTAAVKNYFGLVVGTRKALIHARYGEVENKFESLIFDVMQSALPSFTLLDGIEIMNCTGPIDGTLERLNMIAGSWNPVALDSIIYELADKPSETFPLYREAVTRAIHGANIEDVSLPMSDLNTFERDILITPEILKPISFSPTTLAKSAFKRLWKRYV